MTYTVGLLVTGARELTKAQREKVRAELSATLHDLEGSFNGILYVGDADGVDNEAVRLFRDFANWTIGPLGSGVFVADWRRLEHAAGPERNERMVDQADGDLRGERLNELICLAFPGPESTGTWDCLKRLAARGHIVRVIGLVEER